MRCWLRPQLHHFPNQLISQPHQHRLLGQLRRRPRCGVLLTATSKIERSTFSLQTMKEGREVRLRHIPSTYARFLLAVSLSPYPILVSRTFSVPPKMTPPPRRSPPSSRILDIPHASFSHRRTRRRRNNDSTISTRQLALFV